MHIYFPFRELNIPPAGKYIPACSRQAFFIPSIFRISTKFKGTVLA